jgi:hypothetical protein
METWMWRDERRRLLQALDEMGHEEGYVWMRKFNAEIEKAQKVKKESKP